MNKVMITTAAVLTGALLFAGGAALGATAVPASETRTEDAAKPVPCNLRLVWDRSEQAFQAVYEDSALIGYTPTYGRGANLSCTDTEILGWQEQRRVDGLDADVCRPVLQPEVTGSVHPIGCAVPTMVVTGELAESVAARLRSPDFDAWMSGAARTGFCSNPVRLAGSSSTANPETGEVISECSVAGQPDGLTYTRCGNRRA